jgi:hypothetical protein
MNKTLHNYDKLPFDIKQNILKFIDYTDKNNAIFEFFKYERNIFKNKYTPHHIFIDNYNNLSLSQLEFFYMNINIPYEFIINNQNIVIWDKYVQNKYIHFSIFNNISYILPSIWYNESLTNDFIIKNKNILFQSYTYAFYFASSQNIWKKYPILCQDLVAEFINHFNDNLINGNVNQRPLNSNSDSLTVKLNDWVSVEMQSISSPTYLYYYSLRQVSGAGPGGGTTPANPPSNIVGGALGIFSAHTVQRKQIQIK